MNSKKEILGRVKLLMKYEMGKTLEENYKSIDDVLTEGPVPGLGRIFRIAGEELTGSLRNAIDDVMVFSRRHGGIEIEAANGSIKKATTSRELIDALHNGRITTRTLSELHGGLLRSLETPPKVIEHIITQPGFSVQFRRQFGNLSAEETIAQLKQKGYPNEVIEKMCKKMGIDDSAIYGRNSANQAGHQGQNAGNQGYTPGSGLGGSSTTFRPTQQDYDAIENYIRANYPKLSESQIKTIMGKVQGLANARSLQEFEQLGGKMVETQAQQMLTKQGFNFSGVKTGWVWRWMANNPIKSIFIAYMIAPDIVGSAVGGIWDFVKGRSARAFQEATGLDPANPGKNIGVDLNTSGIDRSNYGIDNSSNSGGNYKPIQKGEFDN
jgi:hypothetical protein